MAGTDIVSQTRQALANTKAVLESSASDVTHIVKTTIFLVDLGDFATVNSIYQELIPPPYPARSCVQVAALPKNGLVEIEVIAGISDKVDHLHEYLSNQVANLASSL